MSTFKRFQKLVLTDQDNLDPNVTRVINQLQGNIITSVNPLNALSQNDSLILESIQLKANQTNSISHGLAQPISGWKQIDIDTGSLVWRVDKAKSTSQFLYLKCSVDCIVSLEVF